MSNLPNSNLRLLLYKVLDLRPAQHDTQVRTLKGEIHTWVAWKQIESAYNYAGVSDHPPTKPHVHDATSISTDMKTTYK